jgi:hypothetical protein
MDDILRSRICSVSARASAFPVCVNGDRQLTLKGVVLSQRMAKGLRSTVAEQVVANLDGGNVAVRKKERMLVIEKRCVSCLDGSVTTSAIRTGFQAKRVRQPRRRRRRGRSCSA